MSQEKYRSCMSKNMGGGRLKGLSKEDRKIEFCTIAKQCSKGIPYKEARQVCMSPKEPKLPRKSKRQRQKEQEACDPNVFFELASQFKDLYIDVHGERCLPCAELDNLIKEAEVPHQIVIVPESCTEIIDKLEVDAFPTVIKMSKGKIISRHIGNPKETIERMKKGE